MSPVSSELGAALDSLRAHTLVGDSREYARRWARRSRLRRLVLPALAACAVLALLALLPVPQRQLPAPVELVTGVGEMRSVTLAEGSRIMLDAASHLRVRLSTDGRDIELLEGQAQFDVTHDSRRPFRVKSGSCEIVAVGTRFNVARLSSRTTVTLLEGRVKVRALSPGSVQLATLAPGQQLQVSSAGQLLASKPVEVENVTAWQQGRVVLDDLSLADALAVLNRYSRTQIVLEGALLQDRRVSGVFRAGDVETEALVLRRYFGLKESSRDKLHIVLEQN
jgi:transmembrane sensor